MSDGQRVTNAQLHGCAFEGWQCFHCGEIFTTIGGARDHFGFDQHHDPACRIKLGGERGLVMALREAQKDAADAWYKIANESHEAAIYVQSMISKNENAMRQIEEFGYAKGLRDYTALQEQRDELLAALKAAHMALDNTCDIHATEAAAEAISKVEGKGDE